MRKTDKIKALKKKMKKKIKSLLKEQNKKMTVSDISFYLKHNNLDEIKKLCKEMYQNGNINFAGNSRYFVITEEIERKKETKIKSEKILSDPIDEIRKYAKLKDDGIITEEEFQAKKKELLEL